MIRTWTPQELETIKANYHKMTNRKLQALLPNKTITAIKAKGRVLGLKKNKGLPVSSFWNENKEAELTKLYPTHTADEIAIVLKCTSAQVKNRVHKLGLTKEDNKGCYKKGSIPANKGKKMSSDAYKKCKGTMFKKGNTPKNHRPVGSIRFVSGYYEIKVKEPRTWDRLHAAIWKKHYRRELQKNELIIFKDGNRLNFDIDNLQKVNRAEHCANTRETDEYIAYTIERDPKKRAELIEKHPEIIELKRNLLKLKKAVNNERKN